MVNEDRYIRPSFDTFYPHVTIISVLHESQTKVPAVAYIILLVNAMCGVNIKL